jgi:hypothetical protein
MRLCAGPMVIDNRNEPNLFSSLKKPGEILSFVNDAKDTIRKHLGIIYEAPDIEISLDTA